MHLILWKFVHKIELNDFSNVYWSWFSKWNECFNYRSIARTMKTNILRTIQNYLLTVFHQVLSKTKDWEGKWFNLFLAVRRKGLNQIIYDWGRWIWVFIIIISYRNCEFKKSIYVFSFTLKVIKFEIFEILQSKLSHLSSNQ